MFRIIQTLGFLKAIQRFHSSPTVKSLLWRIQWFGLYSALTTYIQIHYMPLDIKIDTILLSLLGTLLSLLLVFRTNTAYDRFWEGRKLWGSLVNNARSFAMMVNSLVAEDDKNLRKYFASYLSGYAFALKGHLRDNVQMEELVGIEPADRNILLRSLHVPNQLAAILFTRVQGLFSQNALNGYDLLNIKQHHHAFVDITGACERIKRTPIPYSYNFYIKLFITLYLAIIPFMLIDKYGYYTILAVMLAAYALMGIEMIASEIEEPFGLDSNDLPLDQMSLTIRMNVHEILGVELPTSDLMTEK